MDTFKVLQQAVAAACNQHSAVLAPSLEIFEKLAGLAGAAEIPAVWAAELIAHCIASQQYGYAKVLLKMPIAEQMNCQQLCKLAGMVRRGGGHEFGLYHSIESVLERCGMLCSPFKILIRDCAVLLCQCGSVSTAYSILQCRWDVLPPIYCSVWLLACSTLPAIKSYHWHTGCATGGVVFGLLGLNFAVVLPCAGWLSAGRCIGRSCSGFAMQQRKFSLRTLYGACSSACACWVDLQRA